MSTSIPWMHINQPSFPAHSPVDYRSIVDEEPEALAVQGVSNWSFTALNYPTFTKICNLNQETTKRHKSCRTTYWQHFHRPIAYWSYNILSPGSALQSVQWLRISSSIGKLRYFSYRKLEHNCLNASFDWTRRILPIGFFCPGRGRTWDLKSKAAPSTTQLLRLSTLASLDDRM